METLSSKDFFYEGELLTQYWTQGHAFTWPRWL